MTAEASKIGWKSVLKTRKYLQKHTILLYKLFGFTGWVIILFRLTFNYAVVNYLLFYEKKSITENNQDTFFATMRQCWFLFSTIQVRFYGSFFFSIKLFWIKFISSCQIIYEYCIKWIAKLSVHNKILSVSVSVLESKQ